MGDSVADLELAYLRGVLGVTTGSINDLRKAFYEGGGSAGSVEAVDITDATTIGRSILTAASASATRAVIGTVVGGSGRMVVVAAEADYPSTVPGGGLAGDFVVVTGP